MYIHVYVQESEHEEMLKKQKQLKENERKTKSKKHNDVSDIPVHFMCSVVHVSFIFCCVACGSCSCQEEAGGGAEG